MLFRSTGADPVSCVVKVEYKEPEYHVVLNVGSNKGNLQIFLTSAQNTAIYGASSGQLYEHNDFFMVKDLEKVGISPADVTFVLNDTSYRGDSFVKAGTYAGTTGYGIAGLDGNYTGIESSNPMYGAGFIKIFMGKPFPYDVDSNVDFTDEDVDEYIAIRGLDIVSVAGTFNTGSANP